MPAKLAAKWRTDGIERGGAHHLLELWHHLAGTHPLQVTTRACIPRIIGVSLGDLAEIGAFLGNLAIQIANQLLSFLFAAAFREPYQNMPYPALLNDLAGTNTLVL